jgi:hypothetical protein
VDITLANRGRIPEDGGRREVRIKIPGGAS